MFSPASWRPNTLRVSESPSRSHSLSSGHLRSVGTDRGPCRAPGQACRPFLSVACQCGSWYQDGHTLYSHVLCVLVPQRVTFAVLRIPLRGPHMRGKHAASEPQARPPGCDPQELVDTNSFIDAHFFIVFYPPYKDEPACWAGEAGATGLLEAYEESVFFRRGHRQG